MVDTHVTLCTSGYEELSLPLPKVTTRSVKMPGMTDSGAQMVVGGMNLVHSLGLTRRELIPLATKVNVANNSGLGLLGGILITITGRDKHGNIRETRQLCYISEMVFTLFLSEQACEDLGIIEKDFPSIGEFPEVGTVAAPQQGHAHAQQEPRHLPHQHLCLCQQPQRTERNLKAG